MRVPANEMILASAGSGKTYALTSRIVRLLASGAAPDRIIALTFTRKAAGEFFDKILEKLADAAASPEGAHAVAPGAAPEAFHRLLREVVDAMPRLAFGTLDSFFARMVRSFPFELGIEGDFEILHEHGARLERDRVLRQMFANSGTRPTEAQLEFIESFKRATFGLEEKRLAARLDRFLDKHQELYLAAPDGEAWGNPSRIWDRESALWFNLAPACSTRDPAAALQAILAARNDLNPKQRERLDDFFATLPEWQPGAILPKPVAYLLERTIAVWTELGKGSAEIMLERKRVAFGPDESALLASIVRQVVAAEYGRRIETTRGIHAVLAAYESVYRDTVRRAGRLTFADVQRLLQPGSGTTAALAPFARDLIDWRLDGRFDHWLLDEFQDTSHGQWTVLRSLIDEVVRDGTGARSFFYVGDVKQAIYAWREGDARLFREIFDGYHAQGAHIEERHLNESYRSGPAVLAMVNGVFGQPALLHDLFGDAGSRWNSEWDDHTCSGTTAGLGGQAAWIAAEDENARFARTLDLLREIRPLERGLSAAVLVQKNDVAARLADYLRREGALPAVAESDLHVCTDNPLGAAVLALFKVAAHPGDTLAREHLRMTPFEAVLADEGCSAPDALSTRLLGDVHAAGFEATAETWLGRLNPHLDPDDVFARERMRQIIVAARLFDQTDSRDFAEFVQFLERHTVRESEAADIVRVMTIHKSKGLGFDLVILPDLEGNKLATRRDGLAVDKEPRSREVRWVLDLPSELFRSLDEVLSKHIAGAEADACYEKLALLYVALTRARRGLYVVAKPPGKSTSVNFTKLLAEALGSEIGPITVGSLVVDGAWSAGDSAWFSAIQPATAAPPRDTPRSLDPSTTRRVPRYIPRSPSEARTGTLDGESLFATRRRDALRFGSDVHAALASVERWTVEDAAAWEEHLHATGIAHVAIAEARACLDAPGLATVFAARTTDHPEIWRERGFEAVIDDAWVTGVLDRVHVQRDKDGRATRAHVFEFKTDRDITDLDAAAARHIGQVTLYRRAVALLTGLPLDRVEASIVFTAVRARHPHNLAQQGGTQASGNLSM